MPASTTPHLLVIPRPDPELDNLPPKKLKALTEIRVGHIVNNSELIKFLSRCPNVDTLWCGETWQPARKDQITPKLLPSLRIFTGPLETARLLVPGRPLEEVSAFASSSCEPQEDVVTVAKLMTAGTAQLRHLQIGVFMWQEGCLEEIASLSPHLESLVVFVRGLPKASHSHARSGSGLC